MSSSALLADLIAFPSVSAKPNLDIAAFIADRLRRRGVEAEWVQTGEKASLFATLGPPGDNGVILSGHMDVVPVEGQRWSSDPFRLAERDGRLYGRGAADMKGFLACLLGFVERLDIGRLTAPIHFCFSHDEEIGCVGIRPLLDHLTARNLAARLCIVGEPTELRVVTGHKGKLAAVATCRGVAGHSALAPRSCNAIHLGADLVDVLRRAQAGLAADGARDEDYDVPYSTVHAGLIRGGTALNIVPDTCTVDFEIRTVGADDASALLAEIAKAAARLAAEAQLRFPQADVAIETVNAYPGLATPPDGEAAAFVQSLVGDERTGKVAFGTEGGLFAERLRVPTVICGPGSMAQGHKADEFVAREQIDRCDAMLDRLADRLSA